MLYGSHCRILAFMLLCSLGCNAIQHTHLVIVGGTGNLAQKYLWGSALRLFVDNFDENNTFTLYAGSRLTQTDGDKALADILTKTKCEAEDKVCEKLRPIFIENSKYVVLKHDDNYTKLCDSFLSTHAKEVDIHQIFYFSIPSSAYQSVAKSIHSNCRHDNIASTKVVLEKPFGLDKASATQQAEVIGQYFSDEQVYRVDHYLAKSVSKQILHFRATNRDHLELLMSNQYVDRVEIVMKERIGNKGRIDFYDQTGVVRDVMQNHLTELLALVAMELPVNVSDSAMIERHKLHLLRQVKLVKTDALLVGQYAKYIEEAESEINDVSQSYLTPTFAAALLQVNSVRWKGVPFIIMSGKHMDERSSHVRILFREKDFCVSGCADGNSTFTKYPRQLIFQIGSGPVPSAGILVSKSLLKPSWPVGMDELPMTSKDSSIYGQSPGDFFYAVPVMDTAAYTTVVKDLYHNIKETFVTSTRTLLLWDIWDRVIHETKSVRPRLYKEYEAVNLNFTVDNFKLKYLTDDRRDYSKKEDGPQMINMASIPAYFRNNSLVCKPVSDLIKSLALNIFNAAENAVKQRNVFHIALSGGKTPIPLFHELVNNFPMFPWEQSHIWQVDERCVSHRHENSNFLFINNHLLNYINIPYLNIHPMPVNFAGKLCYIENKGDKLYEDWIYHLVPEQQFDLVLLGLGTDGHTASLFPGSSFTAEKGRLVGLTNSKSAGTIDRMSLLPPLINNARQINVLITGKEKHSILHKIADLELPVNEYPITMISPAKGTMSWFIDLDAWIGQ